MNLKLRIALKQTKDYAKVQHTFAVIDLDVSDQYPHNFVCILPKSIQLKGTPLNIFEKRFKDDSINVATNLLKKALRSRPDADTKKSILQRLKLLEPKKANQNKCNVCGKLFEQKKRGYKKYSACYECYQKRYVKK